ncbi:hypothetical protein [Xanthomonas campestris]|uniref:hypothetical protein n=1 Tax=Xanthomonas campestris TaxID=339 RepID=UPI002B2208E5|nr:hypothetical protein [Xanthomonas campestris]MEA9650573.1 hypothetical protein [Xanthomonas campestris pv. raphani]MEA9737226.1 hypothetical protein [Xanthomonas campestris pv. raphani]MEA9738746.1 hypothetical protein [Xanthomonas campestris pv. raphani]MEA9743454.1 hypothetical protein [Xanthomonas campestris pv. raphani]MEA9747967.1 hypothetical protein [Xanthomonas campestris pv. raphani]
MGQVEVEASLTCLAIQAQVSAGTQNRHWRRCCFSPATYCVSIGITCRRDP